MFKECTTVENKGYGSGIYISTQSFKAFESLATKDENGNSILSKMIGE